MHRFLTCLFVPALLLTACSTEPVPQPPATPPGLAERPEQFSSKAHEGSWDSIDQQACAEANGWVEQAGLLGLYRCTIPYSDGGKTCSDNSDCEGQCRDTYGVTDHGAEPGKMIGHCQYDDNPFGCYSTIEEGNPGYGICVD